MSDKNGTTPDNDATPGNDATRNDSAGTEKAGGLGSEGTIPPSPDGIAAGIGDESSNFNPEEDLEAATDADAAPDGS